MLEPQENVFRVLNERIRVLVTTFRGFEEDAVPFVCECDEHGCFAPVELSLDDYEDICASGGCVLSPAHAAHQPHEIESV